MRRVHGDATGMRRQQSRADFSPGRWCRLGEAALDDARHVDRLPSRSVPDLVAARGAVGDDDGVGRRVAHRRQQRQLTHRERHVDGVGVIAEGAGHAAATGLDRLHREFGNELEHALDRAHRAERFLMAMSVEERAAAQRRERQGEAAGRAPRRARNSSSRRRGPPLRRAAARPWLLSKPGLSSRKPRTGSSARGRRPATPRADIGRERREGALGLAPALRRRWPTGEEGAAAAQRPRRRRRPADATCDAAAAGRAGRCDGGVAGSPARSSG